MRFIILSIFMCKIISSHKDNFLEDAHSVDYPPPRAGGAMRPLLRPSPKEGSWSKERRNMM